MASKSIDVVFALRLRQLLEPRIAVKRREIGIIVDVYPEQTKLKKQLSIANAQNVQNVLIVGSDEIEKKRYTLKNLSTGDQVVLDEDALIRTLSN
mgnify:CR=1 FL=1